MNLLKIILGKSSYNHLAIEQENTLLKSELEAINKSQAMIEFSVDGIILNANENFLSVMGYSLEEIKDRHHRIFVENKYANSTEYQQFWESLKRGEYQAAEYKRIGKNGKEIWIQASYNPILDLNGNTLKVVKYATDITAQKQSSSDNESLINAINKSQATIEFTVDGTILKANENFLSVMEYSLEEIKGRHHRIFVETEYANSKEYRQFWESLKQGEYQAAEYKRIGKNDKEVWIQASYNPILDLNGKAVKVVKYATDITDQKRRNLMTKQVVDEAIEVLSAMSKGDLTQTITGQYDGDFGKLKDDLNSTIGKLTDVMGEITSSAHLVLNGSEEIAQGNTNLSQRTEQQASSLEETASSMEEMTSTVRQNANNAAQADQLATGARNQAEQGGNVVNQAVSAMSEITQSSSKIAAIIGVIDEIAFQTNLLALNAAVEAARAGEQGRGFAVVASEVRNLAGRSATAAKEIKDLIEDSVIKVKEGSKLVDASGQTLEDIMTSVKKVSDIIAEIAAASMEQSEGIEQVNKAISQMDEMTQQNAALVEEAAAASESMGEQAGNLNEMVGFFKTGNTTVNSATTPSYIGTERRQADRPWGSTDTTTVQQKNTQAEDNSVDNGQWETF